MTITWSILDSKLRAEVGACIVGEMLYGSTGYRWTATTARGVWTPWSMDTDFDSAKKAIEDTLKARYAQEA